jgi:hypothetical protein
MISCRFLALQIVVDSFQLRQSETWLRQIIIVKLRSKNRVRAAITACEIDLKLPSSAQISALRRTIAAAGQPHEYRAVKVKDLAKAANLIYSKKALLHWLPLASTHIHYVRRSFIHLLRSSSISMEEIYVVLSLARSHQKSYHQHSFLCIAFRGKKLLI